MSQSNGRLSGYKLPPSIKKGWVQALRSGEYEQGEEQLRTASGKYCCLGVLADCFSALGSKCSPGSAWLPDDVCDIPHNIQKILADLNDGEVHITERHSFDQIANWIEENL